MNLYAFVCDSEIATVVSILVGLAAVALAVYWTIRPPMR